MLTTDPPSRDTFVGGVYRVGPPGSSVSTDDPVLSIVVPLFNEAPVLAETFRVLKRELTALREPYEIIFVDDGSTDESKAVLKEILRREASVTVVSLSRNFGHEIAITAGLQKARGEAAIVIDADLQDPPALIAEMVTTWRRGYEVVYGVRLRREGESPSKKFLAFLFYRLLSRIAEVPLPKDSGDFRLMDRKVIDKFLTLGEDPRFFRGLVTWIGFRQIGLPFVRQPRAAGYSKYHFLKLFRLAFDTITAFSTLPSQILTLFSFSMLFLGLGVTAVTVLVRLAAGWPIPTWGWIAAGIVNLMNLHFCGLAILGEYIVRTHRHTQQRPLFIVDTVETGSHAHAAATREHHA